jgi:hypothetical protein
MCCNIKCFSDINENSTKKFNNKSVILQVIFVNVLTNPAINIFYRFLLLKTYLSINTIWIIITLVEFEIWIFEGVLYKHLFNIELKKAIFIACMANLVSYLSGFIIF